MERIFVGIGRTAIVDPDVGAALSSFSWYLQSGKAGTFYAYRRPEGRKIYMHRLIVGAAPGDIVDHINGDGLDNRRANLRLCSNAENMRNMRRGRGASRYKGVARSKRDNVWRAYLVIDAKQIHLGYHATEEAAAAAYDAAALQHFGSFSKLNFPEVLNGPAAILSRVG